MKEYKPPYPYMEVVWDDASSNSESWVDIADVVEPERVITRGWLVKKTERAITLASSVALEEKYEDSVGNTMTVPLGMIISQREIRVSNASSKSRRKLHPQPDAEAVHREQSESGPILLKNG